MRWTDGVDVDRFFGSCRSVGFTILLALSVVSFARAGEPKFYRRATVIEMATQPCPISSRLDRLSGLQPQIGICTVYALESESTRFRIRTNSDKFQLFEPGESVQYRFDRSRMAVVRDDDTEEFFYQVVEMRNIRARERTPEFQDARTREQHTALASDPKAVSQEARP